MEFSLSANGSLTSMTVGYPMANLTNVNRIVITLATCGSICVARVLPCLRNCPIVPDVTMVGERVGHIPQFSFLCILHNGVEGRLCVYFHFGICPPGNLNDNMEGGVGGFVRDVMERGNWPRGIFQENLV